MLGTLSSYLVIETLWEVGRREVTCKSGESVSSWESAKIRVGRFIRRAVGWKRCLPLPLFVSFLWLLESIAVYPQPLFSHFCSGLGRKGKESSSGERLGSAGDAITSMPPVCLSWAKPQCYRKSSVSFREETPSPSAGRCGGLWACSRARNCWSSWSCSRPFFAHTEGHSVSAAAAGLGNVSFRRPAPVFAAAQRKTLTNQLPSH